MSDNLTVKEIKQKLDDLGVGYGSGMKKAELLELLKAHQSKSPEEIRKYEVIYDFKDLKDNGYVYIVGDIYPREENDNVTEGRIKELMSTENKIGKQLIKERE